MYHYSAFEQAAENQLKQHNCALLYIDVDNFKNIDYLYGHHTSRILIKNIGQRLKQNLRNIDLVGRMDNDELICLLVNVKNVKQIKKIANKILSKINGKYSINNTTIHCTSTIGIAVYPEDGQTYHELINCAEAAMYHAKTAGGARYILFDKNVSQANTCLKSRQ